MKLVLLLSAALLLTGPAVASAQSVDWTVQAGAATDYISKGISKTRGQPQYWGRLEAAGGPDLYAGAWASNADSNGADAEIQLYAGWRPEAWGYQWDASVFYKHFPGANPGLDEGQVEVRGEVSRSIGPANARLRVEYSPDTFGPAQEAWWIDGRIGWKLTSRTQINGGLGRREQNGGADFTAWNVGVQQKLTDKLGAELRWYDTNGHGFGSNYEGRLVAGITATF